MTSMLLISLFSCPEEEEEYTSESEEEKRAAEARIQKIHKLQGCLLCLFFFLAHLNIF